MNASAFPPW
jgi:hypothetical protein